MKTHKYRISEAAVGKILAKVMEMTREGEISSDQFHDTMFAALHYIEGEVEPSNTANINPLKWQCIKELIDKSARRSKSARERAARRRQSIMASAATDVISCLGTESPGSSVGSSTPPKPDAAVAKTERERLERLSREYDEVCRMSYW